jgi:RHS repeat-associated protein
MQFLFLLLTLALQINASGYGLQNGHTETNRFKVIDNAKVWLYKWNANGSLKEVTRPDRKKVQFEYDALERRTVKTYNGKVTRWVWDGNTPLHEWTYDEKERPKIITDEFGLTHKEGTEPTENITTWVFEEGSFRPAAKLTEEKKYSIITDYLGTPVQMYDGKGKLTWEARLDIYGKVCAFAGSSLSDCPFRYQEQYHDAETDLYYNRFRYYDPDSGNYLSQDPIGLNGGTCLYDYVYDTNFLVDIFGLNPLSGTGTVFEVGTYDILKIKSAGLDLDAHHVGQGVLMNKFAKVDGYDYAKAPAILVPSSGHTSIDPISGSRLSTNTKGINNARDLLARDVRELKRVYPDIPISKLQELTELNKKMYPNAFKKGCH